MCAILALTIDDDTGAVLIDGAPVDTDEVRILIAVPAGSEIRKLDYRLTTDREDAVHLCDHALRGPRGLPFAGLGEAGLEPTAGAIAATGLTGSGEDGFILRAIKERGVQVYDAGWQPLDPVEPAGSSVTTTGSFAGLLDPTTTLAAKKRDRKRDDGCFDVTDDFSALRSSTVHVEVLSGGASVAQLPGHGPDIGTLRPRASTSSIPASARSSRKSGIDGISSKTGSPGLASPRWSRSAAARSGMSGTASGWPDFVIDGGSSIWAFTPSRCRWAHVICAASLLLRPVSKRNL